MTGDQGAVPREAREGPRKILFKVSACPQRSGFRRRIGEMANAGWQSWPSCARLAMVIVLALRTAHAREPYSQCCADP